MEESWEKLWQCLHQGFNEMLSKLWLHNDYIMLHINLFYHAHIVKTLVPCWTPNQIAGKQILYLILYVYIYVYNGLSPSHQPCAFRKSTPSFTTATHLSELRDSVPPSWRLTTIDIVPEAVIKHGWEMPHKRRKLIYNTLSVHAEWMLLDRENSIAMFDCQSVGQRSDG